ncbi:MAG: M12 family metallopeptidase [Myxococcota bacterium]
MRIANFEPGTNPGGRACGRSALGRQGGQQTVRLSPTTGVGCLVHELAHALGVAHEQSRADRDDHVIVRTALVDANRRHNFDRKPTCGFEDVGPYDLDSVMHYPAWAFATDPSLCQESSRNLCPIEPRPVDGMTVPLSRIGQRSLSELDRRGLCQTYGNPTVLRLFVDGQEASGDRTLAFPSGARPTLNVRYEWRRVAQTVELEVVSDRDGVVFSGPVRPVAFDSSAVRLADLSAGMHQLTVRTSEHCPTERTIRINVAPALRIVRPTVGHTQSYNRPIAATAEVFGLGTTGALQWNLDGASVPGATETDALVNAGVGRHVLSVQAAFGDGTRLSDQVSVDLTNSAPTAAILAPIGTVCRGEDTVIRVDARDTDERVEDLSIEWFVGTTRFATGPAPTVRFETLGTVRLEVSVTDSLGEMVRASTNVTVQPCGALPTLAVTWPVSDGTPRPTEDFVYTWDGAMESEWFVDLRPTATANDAEDGRLSGAAIEWRTNRSDVQPALLGTGTSPAIRLRGICTGTIHTVTVSATDSDGNVRTQTFVIRAWTLC